MKIDFDEYPNGGIVVCSKAGKEKYVLEDHFVYACYRKNKKVELKEFQTWLFRTSFRYCSLRFSFNGFSKQQNIVLMNENILR